jgi:hypothetical protein
LLLSQFLVVIKPSGFRKGIFLAKEYRRSGFSATPFCALVSVVVGLLHWLLADQAGLNQNLKISRVVTFSPGQFLAIR